MNTMNTNKTLSKNLGIRDRLLIGFSAIILTWLCMVATTVYIIHSTKGITKKVLTVDLPLYEKLIDLRGSINNTRRDVIYYLLSKNSQYADDLIKTWNVTIPPLLQQIDGFMLFSKNNIQQWHKVRSLMDQLKNGQLELVRAKALNQNEVLRVDHVAEAIINEMNGYENDNGVKSDLIATQYETVDAGANKVISDLNKIQRIEYLLSAFGIIFGLCLAYFTSRGILTHIALFRQHSSRIASGDLRNLVEVKSNDEVGLLGNDLNIMTQSLSDITKQITKASNGMVAMLDEVKKSVDLQSSGASEQASSVNEITASLEEIEKSTSQTMDKARALGEAAQRTRERGEQGLEAVEQSIRGMKVVRDKVQLIAQTILDLSNQTQQVGEITAVVNTIAQQSKMLALNASIEAAKAGEAGKGFSVVATEVKSLAEQSEQATIQVQKILEDIRNAAEKAVLVTEEGTKGVDQGTELVEQTGEVVRNLGDVIHETTIATQQIESAIRQESVGIEQITTAMSEINQVTSSFVKNAQQTTRVIESLDQIARHLKEQVDTYKTS